MRVLLSFTLLLLLTFPATAQDMVTSTDDSWCEENKNYNKGRERHCEVREFTLPADRNVIRVDAGQNGGIRMEGWDRDEILVRAKVEASARSENRARDYAEAVSIRTGSTIEPNIPDNREIRRSNKDWVSVSFEIFAPRNSNVSIETLNGGAKLTNLSGDIDFDVLNGGVSLVDLAGHVRGQTTNGGLSVELDGDSWEGEEIDVSTTNGGVVLVVPDDYSARLDVGTVNGNLKFDVPVTVKGKIDNNLKATLGDGGNLVRVRTTNGSVRVKER